MKKCTLIAIAAVGLAACTSSKTSTNVDEHIKDYKVEKFADLQILRYDVPGFEELPLQQKQLVYYLTQAALSGRDILFDQNGKYNLRIRRALEAIYTNPNENKESDEFKKLEVYLKRVWFANGIHHHYGMEKFQPEFSKTYFKEALGRAEAKLPLVEGQSIDDFYGIIAPVMFDPTVMPKRVNQAAGDDLVVTSAANYYDGVTGQEAKDFYNKMRDPNDNAPIPYGMNSRLVKENGVVKEKVWKIGGLYSEALTPIVFWLNEASKVAENDTQRGVITKLITFYETGNLRDFNEYCIQWVKDLDSTVDFVNGFTESYGDPLGMKSSWESLVNFKDFEATKRTDIISSNAQWFEDNSPAEDKFKKKNVKGVSAKVITAAILAGDLYPATAIGINLPNANWIRSEHGSKSVTIGNITDAYNKASHGNGLNEEFVYSKVELDLIDKYADYTDELHTDLHECLGHASGIVMPGREDALEAYGSTIEEARADLFGLYYLGDHKLVELGLLPNDDAFKAAYYSYLMNGLMTQLNRIELGNIVEEAHMRNRQLIAKWVFEKGKADNVVELVKKDNGKTYVVVNDYTKLRTLFGDLLAEIQRIRSTGDFEGAKNIVEQYAVQVDPKLHEEILTRFEALNLAPYKGFVNPVYTAKTNDKGEITDVVVSYTEGYADQMLRYSTDYSFLPSVNN